MSVYVVAGVTGHVGSVVADELTAQGERVRAIVRDANRGARWRDRGAEIAVGTLDDRGFLGKALVGAAGFFALLPPNETAEHYYEDQRRTSDAIAEAVRESGVPLVVMLSSLGAELAEGTGPIKSLHYLENALRAAATKLIAIRASYFQENISEAFGAAREGIYPNLLPSADAAVPMVATRDIGRLAASLLKSPPPASEIIDIIGPNYSPRQLSEKLGAALGKPLRVADIPAVRQVEFFTQAGLPRAVAEALAEMNAAVGANLITPHGDRMVTGMTTIDETLPGLLASAQAEQSRAAR